MKTTSRFLLTILVALCVRTMPAQDLALPVKADSVRFLVMGDTGTGDAEQYDVAKQIVAYRARFPFTFALMLGDNLYGSERPQDFARKFEQPYKALIDDKVEFYAALGNHDDQNQKFYKPFNLGGQRYHTFKKGNARFFVLDSNYMDPQQIQWLEKELQASGSDWKIPFFHHPMYTSATRGPVVELRAALEPIFLKYGVDVVFSGHEHLYERLKPQKGIQYLTVGGSAKLRRGDIKKTGLTEVGYDADRTFLLAEISGDEMFFQTINRTGQTIDRGVIARREVAAPASQTAKPAAPQPQTAKPAAPQPQTASPAAR